MRGANLDQIPCWLMKIPKVEKNWTSLIQTLAGHSDSVSAVTFSSDGRRIASGSKDKTIKVWDVTTGHVEKTLTDHSGWVNFVAFSPDGRRIASGSNDRTIKIWDVTTGQVEKTLTTHSGWVNAVAFSPDGRRIASGSGDKTIMVWDVERSLNSSKWLGSTLNRHLKYRTCQEIQTSGYVSKLHFSADGIYLMTNLGSFKLGVTGGERQSRDVESSLYVNEQWVHCGSTPVLRLPAGFEVADYDVKGDRLAIGLRDGRVLTLNIDCKTLISTISL